MNVPFFFFQLFPIIEFCHSFEQFIVHVYPNCVLHSGDNIHLVVPAFKFRKTSLVAFNSLCNIIIVIVTDML